MGNYIFFVLCLVFVYSQITLAKPCHCGCEKPCEHVVVPPPVLDLGYAPPPCLPKPEPYVYTGPPLPVIVKEPYPFVPPVVPVLPAVPAPCAGLPVIPPPCCEASKLNKLGLLKLAIEHGKHHCDCKKLALKQCLCKHLLKKYQLLCGCV
ncbi:hypothetical protein WDU94_009643 [Cyamophila willieti]